MQLPRNLDTRQYVLSGAPGSVYTQEDRNTNVVGEKGIDVPVAVDEDAVA